MSVYDGPRFSQLCETDGALYADYLRQHSRWLDLADRLVKHSEANHGVCGCRFCLPGHRVGCVVREPARQLDLAQCADGGRSGSRAFCLDGAADSVGDVSGTTSGDVNVGVNVGENCVGDRDSSAEAVGPDVVGSLPRGRWYSSNKEKRERRKAKLSAMRGQWRGSAGVKQDTVGGFCETVISASTSTCPTYAQALSDAEREARDTLAQRRAAENKVARKLAEMKLASLEDEKKCQEYADLKHQRVIQWTNEATAKSQQSVDKLKSIDPSSSASQYEIRQQAKKLADAEAEVRRVSSIVKTLSPDWQELLERKAESTFNTEYVDELMALGAAGRDNGFNY